MYMDIIKLFVENEKELETLIQAIRMYSQDMWMEFSVEKMCHAHNEKRKRQMTEGLELPN